MTTKISLDSINHTDCLIGIKQLPDGSIDTIITDPPYFQGLTHNGQRGELVDLAVCRPFFETLFKEFDRVLKPDGKLYFSPTSAAMRFTTLWWPRQSPHATCWFGINGAVRVICTTTNMN